MQEILLLSIGLAGISRAILSKTTVDDVSGAGCNGLVVVWEGISGALACGEEWKSWAIHASGVDADLQLCMSISIKYLRGGGGFLTCTEASYLVWKTLIFILARGTSLEQVHVTASHEWLSLATVKDRNRDTGDIADVDIS